MNFGAALLAASLAALLLASVPGKIARVPDAEPTQPAMERRARLFLEHHEFAFASAIDETLNGGYRALLFRHRGCRDPVLIAEVSANGDESGMLRRLGGPDGRLFYVYDGRLYDEPPVFRAYFGQKMAMVAGQLGFSPGTAPPPVLAVMEPGGCRLAEGLPWSEW